MAHKLHKKQYEDIYTVDKKGHVLALDRISGVTADFNEYTDLFKDFLRSFYSEFFIFFVKLAWLRRNFVYKGNRLTYPINKNSEHTQEAFVKYLRRVVGMDIQIITRGAAFSAIESYLGELYPDFEDGNPFENPEYYRFPFKNISLEFLVAVYQVEERMLLLKEADNQKMSYAEFLDFVINHVCSVNEELGRKKYHINFNQSRGISFFIKDLDRVKKKRKK